MYDRTDRGNPAKLFDIGIIFAWVSLVSTCGAASGTAASQGLEGARLQSKPTRSPFSRLNGENTAANGDVSWVNPSADALTRLRAKIRNESGTQSYGELGDIVVLFTFNRG